MTVLVANLVVAAALAGLIWTIQVVHYPLFARVGPEHWTAYEAEHQRRITRVVLPLMLANVGLGIAVAVQHPGSLGYANGAIAVGQFVVTGAYYAPQHSHLAREFSAARIAALVRANWARTVGWTAQVVIAAALILH